MSKAKSPRSNAGFAEDAAASIEPRRASMTERVRARENAPKQAVNLTANSAYLAEAKQLGLGLSAIFDAALKRAVTDAQAAAFAEQNAEFLEWYNKDIEENGLWSDGIRLF